MRPPGQAIVVKDIVKVFREKSGQPVHALGGLSLVVQHGEIFGMLGRNGAGKTTLLRILTTLLQPTSGTASVMGFDVQRESTDVRKNICAVLQENAVELYLSVEDNLETYARFHSIPAADITRRTENALQQFGLGPFRHQKVIDLSGGLKRRVQVAKVFMVDKPVVFLDEATTGMDPINKRATIDAIRNQARLGRTIFLTTHILEEAEELCDTIAIIDSGSIVAQGNLQMIKSLATSAFDVSIIFESLTDDAIQELHRLPLRKLEQKGNAVELCINGREISALEALTSLARRHPIVHFEMHSATLEDVFLELLSRRVRTNDQGGRIKT